MSNYAYALAFTASLLAALAGTGTLLYALYRLVCGLVPKRHVLED